MRESSGSRPNPAAVIFVADVARVSAFYGELCSMAVIHHDREHRVLELDGFQLVVHGIAGESTVQPGADGQIPIREDSYVKLCLPVRSIAAARSQALALGGFIKSPEHEWNARGFRACEGHDPEGNVIQVREPAS